MERRARAHGRVPRLILATAVGLAVLGATPWSAFADETPAPTDPAPTAGATPTLDTAAEPSTTPTPAPTAAPTPDAAPAPTATPEPTSVPADHTAPPTATPAPIATPKPSGRVIQSRNLYRYSAMVRQ